MEKGGGEGSWTLPLPIGEIVTLLYFDVDESCIRQQKLCSGKSCYFYLTFIQDNKNCEVVANSFLTGSVNGQGQK